MCNPTLYRVKHKIHTVYKKLIKTNVDCIMFVDVCPQKSVKYLSSRIGLNKSCLYF